jgi:hypothetical protein
VRLDRKIEKRRDNVGELLKSIRKRSEINPMAAERSNCFDRNPSKSLGLSSPISDRRLEVLVRSLD